MVKAETWVEYRPLTATLFDSRRFRQTEHWLNGRRFIRYWVRVR